MRPIATDLQVLMSQRDWQQISAVLPEALLAAGYRAQQIHGEEVDLTCEPDNMLITQYQQQYGQLAPALRLYRVVINGESDLDLRKATRVVVDSFPPATFWYGTTNEGHITPGVDAACAWQG
ncbi:hypothetical protein [Corynebacterium gerontici]|uniref:Uncharacterized protein n=1 Tax=Corynebacterium gerontici TaxID=2079234 RepID=A0A3G6J6Q7_9CORY|nr:hypothetical protein [Corynebacterium gerontici]AZA11694.1 hypothetical protein CGERO_06970 [Corynebacterium gerontici]